MKSFKVCILVSPKLFAIDPTRRRAEMSPQEIQKLFKDREENLKMEKLKIEKLKMENSKNEKISISKRLKEEITSESYTKYVKNLRRRFLEGTKLLYKI